MELERVKKVWEIRSKSLENKIKHLKTLEQRQAPKTPRVKKVYKTSNNRQVDEQVDKQVDKLLDEWVEESANGGKPVEEERLPRLKGKYAKLAFLHQT